MPIDAMLIRKIMLEKDINLNELAEKTNLSKSRISKILNSNANLRNETIKKIAKALKVRPIDIVKEGK